LRAKVIGSSREDTIKGPPKLAIMFEQRIHRPFVILVKVRGPCPEHRLIIYVSIGMGKVEGTHRSQSPQSS
jgi:hypothetical protein